MKISIVILYDNIVINNVSINNNNINLIFYLFPNMNIQRQNKILLIAQ